MAARILVIEDNQANLALVEYLLGHAGYTLLTATNGAAGLRLARELRPDLILCDLQLPELNGYEVLEQIRRDAQLDRIPLVAVTAFSMPGDRGRAISAGFAGHLTKPIEPQTFVAQIEDFLAPELRAARPPAAS